MTFKLQSLLDGSFPDILLTNGNQVPYTYQRRSRGSRGKEEFWDKESSSYSVNSGAAEEYTRDLEDNISRTPISPSCIDRSEINNGNIGLDYYQNKLSSVSAEGLRTPNTSYMFGMTSSFPEVKYTDNRYGNDSPASHEGDILYFQRTLASKTLNDLPPFAQELNDNKVIRFITANFFRSIDETLTPFELSIYRTIYCDCEDINECPNKSVNCWKFHNHDGIIWMRRNPYIYDYQYLLCPRVQRNRQKGDSKCRSVGAFSCSRGVNCGYAHSLLEQMYHPSVYKTRLCKNLPRCSRPYCPFLHSNETYSDTIINAWNQQHMESRVLNITNSAWSDYQMNNEVASLSTLDNLSSMISPSIADPWMCPPLTPVAPLSASVSKIEIGNMTHSRINNKLYQDKGVLYNENAILANQNTVPRLDLHTSYLKQGPLSNREFENRNQMGMMFDKKDLLKGVNNYSADIIHDSEKRKIDSDINMRKIDSDINMRKIDSDINMRKIDSEINMRKIDSEINMRITNNAHAGEIHYMYTSGSDPFLESANRQNSQVKSGCSTERASKSRPSTTGNKTDNDANYSFVICSNGKSINIDQVNFEAPDPYSYHIGMELSLKVSLCISRSMFTDYRRVLSVFELCLFRTTRCPLRTGCLSSKVPTKCWATHTGSESVRWLRRNPYAYEYKHLLCPTVRLNKETPDRKNSWLLCTGGLYCKFAHSIEEQMYHPVVYKTTLCTNDNCDRPFCPFLHESDKIDNQNGPAVSYVTRWSGNKTRRGGVQRKK